MPRPPLPNDVRPTLEPLSSVSWPNSTCPIRPPPGRDLEAELPLDSPAVRAVRAMVERGLAEGWLCPRQNGDIQYGRVFKASEDTHGLGVDAVHMSSPAPGTCTRAARWTCASRWMGRPPSTATRRAGRSTPTGAGTCPP